MKKAKYIGKYIENDWGTQITNLFYEYRGHEYTVYETGRGNEPPAWQHRNEQEKIDEYIEQEKEYASHKHTGPTAEEALAELWEYWEKGE